MRGRWPTGLRLRSGRSSGPGRPGILVASSSSATSRSAWLTQRRPAEVERTPSQVVKLWMTQRSGDRERFHIGTLGREPASQRSETRRRSVERRPSDTIRTVSRRRGVRATTCSSWVCITAVPDTGRLRLGSQQPVLVALAPAPYFRSAPYEAPRTGRKPCRRFQIFGGPDHRLRVVPSLQ